MTTSTNALLSEFLQFMQDLPFAQVGAAAASGFTNVALDFAAGETIAMAAVKDFFSAKATGTTASVTAAPATAAAIADHVASAS